MIQAIIFDCFGVLISDGLELLCQSLETENPDAREFIRRTIWLNNSGQIDPVESNRLISEQLGVTPSEFRAMVSSGEMRNPAVFELVRKLRSDYKTALLSNIGSGSLKRRFSQAEMDQLFDVVVVSGDVGMLKPDLAIYRHTAERLGVEPSGCVFLDDRQAYAEAARTTGMQAIWFRNFDQAKAELDTILNS